MGNADVFEMEGTVIEALPEGMYRVAHDNGHVVKACISDEMKANYVSVLVGDRVKVEVSTYDPSRGCIVERYK